MKVILLAIISALILGALAWPFPTEANCIDVDYFTDDGLPPNGIPLSNCLIFTTLGAKYNHPAITHRDEEDPETTNRLDPNNQADYAAALALWGSSSAITDGGAGMDVTSFIDPNINQIGTNVLGYAYSFGNNCQNGFRAGYEHRALVVTHELGHCLGLGHEDDVPALMGSSGGPFSQDDRNGICFLYPPCDGVPAPSPSPSSTPTRTPTSLSTPTSSPQPPTATRTPIPTPTTTPGPPCLPPLASGWNLVTAIAACDPASVPGVNLVYRWDGEWHRWARFVPGYVNDIQAFQPGAVYWVFAVNWP